MVRADRERVWQWVADERVRLAEVLDRLQPGQWDEKSLCDGWRVRDVIGHLVWLAELPGTRAAVRAVVRQRCLPNAAVGQIAREVGETEPAELVNRLRAARDGRFVVAGAPRITALGEVITHRADIAVPLELGERPADERMQAVISAYRFIPFVFGTTWRASRLRYVATDGGWAVGHGPDVRGTGQSLLLALTGRPVAGEAVTGPGVRTLLGQP